MKAEEVRKDRTGMALRLLKQENGDDDDDEEEEDLMECFVWWTSLLMMSDDGSCLRGVVSREGDTSDGESSSLADMTNNGRNKWRRKEELLSEQ